MIDVLVVGSGPAGVSAALAARASGAAVMVASLPGSYLLTAPPVTDYYGLDGLTGDEIYRRSLRQLEHAGVTLQETQVTGLLRRGDGFVAVAEHPIEARRVILATGRPADEAAPAAVSAFEGAGVFRRVEGNDFVARGRLAGVLGVGPYALAQARLLQPYARAVTLFTDGRRAPVLPAGWAVQTYPVAALEGNGRLERIRFADGSGLNLDALFLADRTADAADLAVGAGARVKNGRPTTDFEGRTTMAGLFAVGDCAGVPADLQERVRQGRLAGRLAVL